MFDVLPLQSPDSRHQSITESSAMPDPRALWIEYRSRPEHSIDDIFSIHRPMFEGALIRAQSSGQELYSDLLDFSPGNPRSTSVRRLLLGAS